MSEDRWNREIRLLPHDKAFRLVLDPLIPRWVRPNHVTVARIFLTPLVVYLLFIENYSVGVPLFVFVALTDALDGSMARVRKQITAWGIIYDPLADKLFIGSVLFLIVLHHINYLLGMALLFVEGLIIVGGWVKRTRGKIEPANVWGKIKMVAEVFGVSLLLLALWLDMNLLVDLSTGTLAVALVVAIVSILSRMR